MNIKHLISRVIFGALLISAIQMPIYAVENSYGPAIFRLLFGKILPSAQTVDQKGQEFASAWSAESDGTKAMGVLGLAIGSYFLLNWAFSSEKVKAAKDQNKSSNLFSLLFGILGIFGLKDYINQKMDEGSKDLNEQFGFNMNNPNAFDQNLQDIGQLGNIALRIANRNNQAQQPVVPAPVANQQQNNSVPQPQAQPQQNNAQDPFSIATWWNWIFAPAPVQAPAPQAPVVQQNVQPSAPELPAPGQAAVNRQQLQLNPKN